MSTAGRGGDALTAAARIRASSENIREQTGTDFHGLGDDALLALADLPPGAEADARAMTRRLANRHGCKGLCRRKAHARDRDDALTVLLALGLLPDPLSREPDSWGRRKQIRELPAA